MKKSTQYIVGAVILVLVVIGLGIALSSHSSMGGMASAPSAANLSAAVATNNVTIQGYAYTPKVIKVKLGTQVTWTNKDSVSHSVTTSSPSTGGPMSPLFSQNQTYSFTFKKAGTFQIYCQIHPYMLSTVIVTQ